MERLQSKTEYFDWTPTLTFQTPGTLVVAYTTRHGRGERSGNVVTLWWNIVTSTFTLGTAAGLCVITGTPYTPFTSSGYDTVGSLSWQGITKATYTQIEPEMISNDANIYLLASGSGVGLANIAVVDTPTGGTVVLRGQIRYRIA